MKRRFTFWVFPLLAAACSYGTNTSGQVEQFTSDLSEQERACVEGRLLTGWDLNLADPDGDLSPEEEIAVDTATELCDLNPQKAQPPYSNR
ncbi:MAG: hypothetical protein Ct9H300mP26_2970 [Acidimicrobiales bacterium]|nr:MAG: hypothetical protein Ct9H300mP26_2970 [Acidimicrobiales bacterium]